jgi:glycyl-tRNA synthetase
MNNPLDFQSIMMTLQQFWARHGCLIWQPYYTQVGAGTMNPATYLRVLGPEPWNVGYVEPSVRPDDGRYGENPNRLQQHYQFQVILKPDPGNPQDLYLQSLEALGIDPRQHDIRFVEDNWESPALGAWGLGWEVWLDGQEITQFTYFQQAGGMVLDPVAVEITYGLERIAMPLQRVRNFRNIHWNQQRTYGDVNLQAEQEHSKYYFEVANVEQLRQQYNLFEGEANAALENNLVLPAHDYVLKCSHTFNILDTRGAIGVTERQALFSRMRDLARRVADAYVAQRESLGFPMKAEVAELAHASLEKFDASVPLPEKADFLLEIGTEELPAADMQLALTQLQERFPSMLDELRLEHGEVKVLGTPRRLVILASGLASRQPDRAGVVKGPPASRAYDASGTPTPAAVGFARSRGLDVKDLEVREIDGGQYVSVIANEKGRPAPEVLAESIPGLISGLKFEKMMRWNSSNVAFSRPIRWLLALYGEHIVPFGYAGYTSGRVTRGLRFRSPEEFEIKNPAAYFTELQKQGIILDPAARRSAIADQVKKLMQQAGGLAKLDEGLLDEVNQLVEAPTALMGKFDESHLALPAVVLVSVMKKHQRYFPVYAAEDKLLPYFIAVRNGDDHSLETVIDGNEQVIRARFADAAFFIDEDLKHRLEDFLPRLSTLTFQFKLGSMLDRSKRITGLVDQLAGDFHLNSAETATAKRAAYLCKADLVAHMVVEMTSVQGAMGKFYALNSGESPDVAQAIYEHYLPRYSGDDMPKTLPGFVVGVADRLDALSGLFGAGLAPSGTKDPFALRRVALGLVQSLIKRELDFDLSHGLELAAKGLPFAADPKTQAECLDFIIGRLRSTLIEQGFKYDVVDAVLGEQSHNPSCAFQAILQLSSWIERPDWSSILPAYSRCVRITRDQKQEYPVNPDALVEPSEKELFECISAMGLEIHRPGSVEDFFKSFLPLIPVINRFFDQVLVMADDPRQRSNRLGLLQRVASLAKGVADFSKLEGF